MPPNRSEVNVQEEGAVGDGEESHAAQDTKGFLVAIKKARSRPGTVVRVPPGTYFIKDELILEEQTLLGAEAPAWGSHSPDMGMPTVIPRTGTTGPCVRLGTGGAVHGIHFKCDPPQESEELPIVLLYGVGCRVSEVRITDAWDAIIAGDSLVDPYHPERAINVGRSVIEKCFITNVRNIGVAFGTRFSSSPDVSWISKVEVWSNRSVMSRVGFELGKADTLMMSDCLAFNCKDGYLLWEQPGLGGIWGSFSNCSSDFCERGVHFFGKHRVSINGGSHWAHLHGIKVAGNGSQVRVNGSELKSNGGSTCEVVGGQFVTLAGCHLRCRDVSPISLDPAAIACHLSVTGCVLTGPDAPFFDIPSGAQFLEQGNHLVVGGVD
jgi:hypothetical protein